MSSTIIDDQDLSRVKYTGTWVLGGSSNEHNGTVASSTNAGDYFTVKFSGNSIAVYGTIDITSGGVIADFSVDNAASQQFTSQAGIRDRSSQQFWQSPVLDVGDHVLLVTMDKVNNNSLPDEGTIWFDYFLASEPTIRAQDSAQHFVPIIGGVIGGKREPVHVQPIYWPKNEIDSDTATPFIIGNYITDQTAVEPFILGCNPHDASSLPPNMSSPASNSELPRKSAIMDQSRRHTYSHTLTTSAIPHNSSSPPHPRTPHNAVAKPRRRDSTHGRNATTSPSTSSSSQPLQHVDSGVRAIDMETGGIPAARTELPPVYSPV